MVGGAGVVVAGFRAVQVPRRRDAAAEGARETPARSDARMLEVLQVSREPARRSESQVGRALRGLGRRSRTRLAARRSALRLLFAERAIGLRLQRVLEAVNADSTPPEDDPLWQDIVNKLSEQWNAETASTKGAI